ncbi:MAG: hypothetical protein JSR60_18705 [Proteobacteria bacterium]|nr:hypothetical protein [Pseudomonadota bacterium]
MRIGGWTAIAGGALRIADSFAPGRLPEAALTGLYFVTDVLLLAGIAAIAWSQRDRLGAAGTLGVAIFVAGILAVRASAFGIGGYALGAAVSLVGLAIYAGDMLIVRRTAAVAPILWIVALVLGIAGALGISPEGSTVAAGIAFGLGFVAAGLTILSPSPSPAKGTARSSCQV